MKYGKVACYLRGSTHDQKTVSQMPDVLRWLTNHGYTRESVRWFEDKETAAHLNRPAFEELQKALFMGEVETVVVWHTDRLSRNHRDGVNLIHDWCDRGIRLISVNQQLDLDSTIGKAVAGLLFAIAQDDREKIHLRQAEGIAIAREKGVYKGRKKGAIKGRKKGSDSDAVAKVAELKNKGVKISDICGAAGIARRTYYRYLKIAESEGLIIPITDY